MLATLLFSASLVASCAGLHNTIDQTQSAWNGVVLPGAVPAPSRPSDFVPYYVPAGDIMIDDTSPAVAYKTNFRYQKLSKAVNGTLHSSTDPSSSISFAFQGSRIEWFGQMNAYSGIASVTLDDVFVGLVDAYNPSSLHQQRLFGRYDLSSGTHTLVISNTGKRNARSRGTSLSIDAFVVPQQYEGSSKSRSSTTSPLVLRDDSQVSSTSSAQSWNLVQRGRTGVAAMQLAVVSNNEVLLLDKVEHNLIDVNGHPAWGALYDLRTDTTRALNVRSNSFCAGGTWLSNGTMLSVGGNPVVETKTGAADFGDVDGLQAIRMFDPCDDGKCDISEDPNRIRLTSARWYTSSTRLEDGSVMIIGGSLKGGWINNATVNNPTIEFFPPKNIHGYNGLQIPLKFLSDTLNANLFPIAFTLPDGRVFIAANQDATIYDWKSNTEQSLPQIPNGVRISYPMTGTGLLLPLTPENNYTPEVLLCGGSTIDDTRPGYTISSSEPASAQCSRLVLSHEGIKAGWSVEFMPQARLMPDAVLLPDGQIIIVNGAGSGIAGYGNVLNQVGASNAANPVFTPVLYDPLGEAGKRFSSEGMPTSNIPRLYHSVASLTPNGSIMIAGSNPNLDRSNIEYATEYRVEWLEPPYMNPANEKTRPIVMGIPTKTDYNQTFTLDVQGLEHAKDVKVSLMDLGFVTHALHMNSRLVYLAYRPNDSSSPTQLIVEAPPRAGVYPPGPAWLYVVVDGVPSVGKKVMVGSGEGPPVDEGAIKNMLAKTKVVKSGVTELDNSE